jgi:MoxR-like ATPase
VELRPPAAAHPCGAGGHGRRARAVRPRVPHPPPAAGGDRLRRARGPLIDEIDRADDEFEAFLLEVLSDFQITIPEIGTITARRRPAVILTSNRTRELHDALKRRCLFHWITHPSLAREIEIVRLRVPGVSERLAAATAAFVAGLRGMDLAKAPGVAETIDWTQALVALGCEELDATVVEQTLGAVLKHHEDLELLRDETMLALLGQARAAAA